MIPRSVTLRPGADLDGFQSIARALVADGVAPDQVVWTIANAPSLYAGVDAAGADETIRNFVFGSGMKGTKEPNHAETQRTAHS